MNPEAPMVPEDGLQTIATLASTSRTILSAAWNVNSLVLFSFLAVFSTLGFNPVDAAHPATMLRLADAPVVADSAWFDSESRSLRPVELNDTQVDAENRDSRWLPKAKSAPKATTSHWGDISLWNLGGWVFLVALIVGIAWLLLTLFANSSFEFHPNVRRQSVIHRRALDESTKQRIAELPAELRDARVNPRAELERLMQIEDFDRAIIFLYGHQLLMLDRVGWLRLSRWKTNNQYVRETRQSHADVGEQLGHTATAFERSYFGKHPMTRELFHSLWRENLQIEEIISTTRGGSS